MMKLRKESIARVLKKQKEERPLIHCMSDISKSNDLEQSLLCFGGRCIMAYGIEEVYEITSISNGLLIGLGALDNSKILAMEKSLRVAKKKNIPVILDINGVNYSIYRRNTALSFLNRYNIDIIKGTDEEIKGLINSQKHHKNKEKDGNMKNNYRDFARKNKVFLVVKDEVCYITDGFSEFNISNGSKGLEKIFYMEEIFTGMLAVTTAICESREEKLEGLLIAILAFTISQEFAEEKLAESGIINLKESFFKSIMEIDAEKIDTYGKIIYEFKVQDLLKDKKS